MRSATLRTRIATKLTHNLLVTLALVAVGVAGVATQETVYAEQPAVTNSPAALMAEHGCWTGEAPADMQGVVPGHVVVSVDGSPRVGGERLVGKALAQIFDDVDHGLLVHGFCR